MRLLYDLRATQPSGATKRHGGGRYGEIIFFRMAEMGLKFGCFYDSRLWFNPDVKAVIDEKGIVLHDVAGKKVQEIIDEEGYDRIYSCLPGQVFGVERCTLYGTLHGMRIFETPNDKIFWRYKSTLKEKIKFIIKVLCPNFVYNYKKRIFQKEFVYSKFKMITVSEHSMFAMLSFFPDMKDRGIKVFYSPNTSTEEKRVERREKNDNERYFLAVSGNRWEKNNLRAIEAFDRLLSAGLIKDVRMKVTGAKDASIYRYKIKNPEAFDFLGYVSEEELEQLYAGAYLFVYPSLNEGFGYPPIEAMRYKVPVIASPLSSMAEILDQGALYFNPFLVEEIMNRMLMMMEPERHSEFSERGYRQYLKISERQECDLEGVIDYILN